MHSNCENVNMKCQKCCAHHLKNTNLNLRKLVNQNKRLQVLTFLLNKNFAVIDSVRYRLNGISLK